MGAFEFGDVTAISHDANPLANVRLKVHIGRRRNKSKNLPLVINQSELRRTGAPGDNGAKSPDGIVRSAGGIGRDWSDLAGNWRDWRSTGCDNFTRWRTGAITD